MTLLEKLDALRAKVQLPWCMPTTVTGYSAGGHGAVSFFTNCGPELVFIDRSVAMKAEDAEYLCAVANAYDTLREVVEAAREVIDSGDLQGWKKLSPEGLQRFCRENRLVSALNNVKEVK